MATWNFYAWLSGEDTAANASSALALDSSSALSFGGGTRVSFETKLSLDVWNTAMHFVQDTADGSVDMCNDSHLWPVYPHIADLSSDTGAVVDGEYVLMANGTPDPARGIGLRFIHGFGVQCNPVQIWAGTGGDVTGYPQNCEVAIASLTSSVPTWATVSPVTKFSLEPHGTASEEHWWNITLSLRPTVVGHNGNNKIMVDVTYY